MGVFFAKPQKTVFVNIAKPEPIVAGLYAIEPVSLQRGGTKRYYQRPRLKPSTRDAFLVIIKLILLIPLVSGYSLLSPCSEMDRNCKNTSNFWALMASILMFAVLVVSLISALITLNRLKVKSVWKLITNYNFECFVTPFKVMQRSGKWQKNFGFKITEQHFIVKAELHVFFVQKSKRHC